MKYNCDLISDLLPLYKDEICSEASRKIIEEHLAECPDCKKMLNSLNDVTIDEKIVKEKEEVIGTQAKFFKRKSALAGSIIGLIFSIPILVCLIVNLATGAGLTWFFIVLAGILVVCIYSGGNWFFVTASATLFGLTVLFAPFIVSRRPVNAYIKNRKGLAIMCAYTATFVLMMLAIGFYAGMKEFFPMAFAVSMPLVGIAWAMFAIIRYLRFNACVKTGLCIASAGALTSLISVLGPAAEASISRTGVTYSSGVSVPPLTFVVIGLVIAGIGFLVGKNKGGKK